MIKSGYWSKTSIRKNRSTTSTTTFLVDRIVQAAGTRHLDVRPSVGPKRYKLMAAGGSVHSRGLVDLPPGDGTAVTWRMAGFGVSPLGVAKAWQGDRC